MVTNRLLEIKQSGQSIWIDNLSRDLIQSGELQNLVENQEISGVTSNPAIFEKAIIGNVLYDADIEAGIRASLPTSKIYESLIFPDVRDACDILYPVYQQTNQLDGYVSIEVPPTDDIPISAKLQAIKGKVAIANAKLAYQEFKKIIQSQTWQSLAAKNAQLQRLLWASTSTKDPSYSDVMYVEGLIGKNTINTLAPSTITACADHCQIANTLETGTQDAYNLIESLQKPEINIDLNSVMSEVLHEGIEKFIAPFQSLMNSLEGKVRLMSTV